MKTLFYHLEKFYSYLVTIMINATSKNAPMLNSSSFGRLDCANTTQTTATMREGNEQSHVYP